MPSKSPPPKPARERVPTAERRTFAANFRTARLAAQLTQHDIRTATGIALSYISGVECAQRNLTIDLAATLATAVGVPLHKLLTPPR